MAAEFSVLRSTGPGAPVARGCWHLVRALLLGPCALGWAGAEGPVLEAQRAVLLPDCPSAQEASPEPLVPSTKPTPWRPSVLTSGSGLEVLADWLDGPPEPGSVRNSWLVSDYLPVGADRTTVRLGCLVLSDETSIWRGSETTKGSAPNPAKEPPPDKDKTRVLAEVSIEASADGTALRLRPLYMKLRPSSSLPQNVHTALYAAVWLNGVEVGVTGFQLPSRPREVDQLLPGDLAHHDGLWLPVPTEAADSNAWRLLTVLAVLHQSARGTDVHAHLARMQARARNAGPRMLFPYPGAPAVATPAAPGQ